MVDFSAISPHLLVKISPKAKRLALRLDSRARRVNLVIPSRASLRKAYEFAESNRHWINSKIESLPAPIPYTNGTIIPLFGVDRRINIEKTSARTTTIDLTDTEILVRTPLDDVTPRIARFIRNYALTELGHMARQKAAQLDRTLKTLVVRDMKSRWGSCSTDGRMSLSWRLIFAPLTAADYVVSHEAAHLIHPNHGPKFWALCQQLSTDFETGHNWMHQHSALLGRYGESYPLEFAE